MIFERKEGTGYAIQNVLLFGQLIFESETQKKDNQNTFALFFGGVYSIRDRGDDNNFYRASKEYGK